MRACAILTFCLLSGCKSPPFSGATSIIAAQVPGNATGAGAQLVGPTNSATASTQSAERRVAYYPTPSREPLPRYMGPTSVVAQPVTPDATPPAPAWIDEKVITTIGQHQDAAAVVKLAAVAANKPMLWWLGLCCIAVCVGGLLWSHANPDGYPVIFWKVGACGVFFMFVGENPLWLFLLLIPLGFYAIQRLGLWKLP